MVVFESFESVLSSAVIVLSSRICAMRLGGSVTGRWWIWIWWCWKIAAVSASSCKAQGVCRCEFDNGDVIDLSEQHNLAVDAQYMASVVVPSNDHTKWSVDTYYFHPCKDIPLGDRLPTNDECKSASVCRHSVEFTKTNTTYIISDDSNNLLGNFQTSKIQGENGKINFAFTYKTISTRVFLECIESDNPKLVVDINDANKPVLIFYSKYACLHSECHRSLGTTLLIILFVIVLLYLVSGICVKYFLMGARGIEVLPNLPFWKDLPELVKDGVAFMQNGFKPPFQHGASTPGSNPTANSYDSI